MKFDIFGRYIALSNWIYPFIGGMILFKQSDRLAIVFQLCTIGNKRLNGSWAQFLVYRLLYTLAGVLGVYSSIYS